MGLFSTGLLARTQPQPSLEDRQLALLRFFVLCEHLRLFRLDNAGAMLVYRNVKWMAGKYEP